MAFECKIEIFCCFRIWDGKVFTAFASKKEFIGSFGMKKCNIFQFTSYKEKFHALESKTGLFWLLGTKNSHFLCFQTKHAKPFT